MNIWDFTPWLIIVVQHLIKDSVNYELMKGMRNLYGESRILFLK